MIRSLDSMLGSSIVATDGEIGKVYNIFFDDRLWGVRYLVVETGSWLMRRKVLIPPAVLGRPNWGANTIPVFLTKEQVQHSPDVDTDQPVSRQQQVAMIKHYGCHDHLGMEPFPPPTVADPLEFESETALETEGDPHLRSAKEVSSYSVEAVDGTLGTVVDYIIGDEGWGIPDLVVSVERLPKDQTILIPTQWVFDISWEDRRVRLNQSRETCMDPSFLTEG